jgi:hypothetical protein
MITMNITGNTLHVNALCAKVRNFFNINSGGAINSDWTSKGQSHPLQIHEIQLSMFHKEKSDINTVVSKHNGGGRYFELQTQFYSYI